MRAASIRHHLNLLDDARVLFLQEPPRSPKQTDSERVMRAWVPKMDTFSSLAICAVLHQHSLWLEREWHRARVLIDAFTIAPSTKQHHTTTYEWVYSCVNSEIFTTLCRKMRTIWVKLNSTYQEIPRLLELPSR